MFEKWRQHLHEGKKCCALFVDLSKAFNNLQHDLLLAKLNEYRFSYKSINPLSSFYQKEDLERTLIRNTNTEKMQRLVCHWDEYLDLCYLIFTCANFFL